MTKRGRKYLLLLAVLAGIMAVLAGIKEVPAGTSESLAGTKEVLTGTKEVPTGILAVSAAENTAARMQLEKTEGSVNITDSREKTVPLIKRMRLYHGYRVGTMEESYAWINLDSVKLIKLDAVSEASVRKKGKNLEVLLDSGNLFFHVSRPLADDESLTIRTSTMAMGVRGTCGWVEVTDENRVRVSILEGTVTASVTDPVTGEIQTERISGGETAVCITCGQDRDGSRCEILRNQAPYAKEDIRGFVLTELFPDAPLREKIYRESGIDLRDLTEEEARQRLQEDEEEIRKRLAEIADMAAEGNTAVYAQWGEPKWSYDAAAKTLTISGSGDMEDYIYYMDEPPWSPYKSEIVTIVVEAGITRIGDLAFEECSSLTGIALPEGITRIGYRAFSGCSSLDSIVLPKGVMSIGYGAFSDCSSLTDISIPKGVVSIGDRAFEGCSSLGSIRFGGTETEWNGLRQALPCDIIFLSD